MATEKRLIDAKGKFVLNAGDLTGNIMCFENGYATVFDRFAKVICKFSILDAPTVDAVDVVRCKDCYHNEQCICVCCEDGEMIKCGLHHKHMDANGYCHEGWRC